MGKISAHRLRLSTKSLTLYLGIAHAYFGLNKIDKAIKFALKALKEKYDEVVEERIYFLLAFCYGMGGIHCNTKKEHYYTEKLQKEFPDSAYLRELKYGLFHITFACENAHKFEPVVLGDGATNNE